MEEKFEKGFSPAIQDALAESVVKIAAADDYQAKVYAQTFSGVEPKEQ